MRVLHYEPCLRDALHPGATDRHDLAEEVQPVVVVAAQAQKRARGGVADPEAHSACASNASSGVMAASIAARSESESVPSCADNQAVRLLRITLRTRSPSDVTSRSTRRRSCSAWRRVTSPEASRRSICVQTDGIDMPSRDASSAILIPGLPLI